MERHDVLTMMTALKLAGMRAAYDDILADGLKRRHPVQQIIGTLLQVEIADKQARSIKYQMASARLPTAKELADFDFAASPVNEPLIQELAGGGFLEGKRNIVLGGGTGTGKTHLAVTIARSCIRKGARGRCYNVVDLVNHLEAELRAGRQGRTADQLVRRNFVILDELGYLPARRILLPLSSGDNAERARRLRTGPLAQTPRRLQTLAVSGCYCEVDLAKLVKEIVVAPFAEDCFFDLVHSIAGRNGLGDRARTSTLSDDPTFTAHVVIPKE